MATPKSTPPKPAAGAKRNSQQIVTPHLVCRGAADAITFYKKAFGAKETIRLPGPDGRLIHARIEINGGGIMLVDEMPEWGSLSPLSLKGSSVTIHLNVADVDAFVARAVKAGAALRMPVADMFWGDRYGLVADPFGHNWSIATHIRDMTADEIIENMQNFAPPPAPGKA